MSEQSPKPVVVAVGNDPVDCELEYAAAEALRQGCGLHVLHAILVTPTGPYLVLPFLPPTLHAMVKLQRLTGMRSGELCVLRTCDVDTSFCAISCCMRWYCSSASR